MDVTLKPPPSPEWSAEYDRLTRDEWLRRKTHRTRRLEEHASFLRRYAAELWVTTGTVLDLGCGPGETLEIARELGHEIYGVDAPDGHGGMGHDYVKLSRLMQERQRIPVCQDGLLAFLAATPPQLVGACLLITSRGSIEQILSEFMDGDSHEHHHECRRMTWKPEAAPMLRAVMVSLARLLQDNGHILIHANGSKSDDWYNRTIRAAGEHAGLKLVRHEGLLLHKWGHVHGS